MNKKYLSFDDIEYLTRKLCDQIESSGWKPTIVVGVSRGGLLPAKMISYYWGTPMCTMDVSLRDNSLWYQNFNTNLALEIFNNQNILVVDDINDSGATSVCIKNTWSNSLTKSKEKLVEWPSNQIKFGVLLENQASSHQSNYWGIKINKELDPVWYVFPWEISRVEND